MQDHIVADVEVADLFRWLDVIFPDAKTDLEFEEWERRITEAGRQGF